MPNRPLLFLLWLAASVFSVPVALSLPPADEDLGPKCTIWKDSQMHAHSYNGRKQRAATARRDRLWPNGVIPYVIASNFTGEHGNLFKKAMRHWEVHTCVSFVPHQPSHTHYILFTIDKCGCCSYVGRRGDGPQAISIGKNCDKFGIVVHELGHVIGFWHEHTRPDRDQFVDIFYKSIQPGQDYNFEKAKAEEVDSLGESYDFLSIMHYARDTFSRGLFHDTILPKNSAVCGGAIFADSGQLVTNGSLCVWRLVAPEGHTIFLNVSASRLTGKGCSDVQSDKVIVRDGYTQTANILDSFCGGEDSTPRTLVSSTNRLLVEATNNSPLPNLFIATFDVICGGPLYASSGRIESPHYPEAYPPNADCLWSIRVAEGRQVALKIVFLHLEQHKECIYDRVVIYEGGGEEGPPLSTLCGQTTTTQELDECESSSNPCEHRCVNKVGGYECACDIGYSLRSDGKTCESTCGGLLRASSGELSSPGFPAAYPSSKTCVWEIESPFGTQLFINITHLNIEGMKNDCAYDYLRIGDREKLCGEHVEPLVLTSKNNRVRVEFASDASVERDGFFLAFYADEDECASENNAGCEQICHNRAGGYECACHTGFILGEDRHNCKEGGCFFQLHAASGEISSPNYPIEYPKASNCTWHFVTTPGHRLSLYFDEFSVEEHVACRYDAVSIQDGPDSALASLGTYCGTQLPPPVLSSTNQLLVHFHTDASVSKRGFHAHYESVCGGQLQAERTPGFIYSHATYSDSRYSNGRGCRWRIVSSTPSLGVRLRFESFHIEADSACQYDFVEVYDGEVERPEQIIGRFCGETIPAEIVSSGESLLLLLHTDDSVEEKGFVAEYSQVSRGSSPKTVSPIRLPDSEAAMKTTLVLGSRDFVLNGQRRR